MPLSAALDHGAEVKPALRYKATCELKGQAGTAPATNSSSTHL